MKKNLPKNPALLIVYALVAAVIIANIFISGYWFGRAQQVMDGVSQPVAAFTSP